MRLDFQKIMRNMRSQRNSPLGFQQLSQQQQMASAVTTQRIGSENAWFTYAHVPNSTAATILTYDQGAHYVWFSPLTANFFGVQACNTVLTGNGLTLLEIVGSTTGGNTTGTNVTQIVSSGVLTGTAVPNGAFIECEIPQLREVAAAVGHALNFIGVRLTVANAADVIAVSVLQYDARRPQLNLTPATM